MALNHYLVLMSGSGLGRREAERLCTEIVYYLDDRSWPVRVRYHDQLPGWVRHSRWLSNVWYGTLLLFSPWTTLVLDCRLLPYLTPTLRWIASVKSRELILVAPGKNLENPVGIQPASAGDQAWAGKIAADQIIVDTAKTRIRLLDQGVQPDIIRTLHTGRSFLTLYCEKHLVSEVLDSETTLDFESETENDLPENLRDTVDQLDITRPLLSGSLKTWRH